MTTREEIDKVLILATGKTGEDLDKVKRQLSELGVVIRVDSEVTASFGDSEEERTELVAVESLI